MCSLNSSEPKTIKLARKRSVLLDGFVATLSVLTTQFTAGLKTVLAGAKVNVCTHTYTHRETDRERMVPRNKPSHSKAEKLLEGRLWKKGSEARR